MSRRERGGLLRALAMLLVCMAMCSSIYASCAFAEDEPATTGSKIDAVLLVDASGSMLATDPLKLRFEGAKLFLQFLDQDDRVALVSFSGDTKVLRGLEPYDPSQAAAMTEAIDGIKTEGAYTDIFQAIKTGQEILDGSPRADAQRIMILLSDGKMEPDPAVALQTLQELTRLTREPLPASRKVYVEGSHPGVRVPMREH